MNTMGAASEYKKYAGTIRGPRPLFLAPPPLGEDGRFVIRKVLIANRGEIACRIIKACRKLNITSVAVYVTEDALSRHVRDADESINIGSIVKNSRNPFLDMDLLIQTAISAGAQAIHPGYGYLSENADFARHVHEAGLIFIGPSPSAMSTLGDKRSSKAYLGKNVPDVPLIPGFAGPSQDIDALGKAADEIGYPVMLKASAGGGGKGMRIVHERSQLEHELERARSEAERSFGSSDVILEKYIENSKHVEIQILGDRYGEVISLFDRDCSVQRRHQKVIEESPCIFLTEGLRRKMSETAIRIGKLIGYENAGTVEFVVDAGTNRFYFLEVNARLQVEHPVTEEVTGVDLVSLQLFVAAGGRLEELPLMKNLVQHGHAIECRLCAEDPQRNFFPEHGKIHLWLPAADDLDSESNTRFETAVHTGSSVSIYFDSMIAKVVVWAPTRALAIEKMIKTLAHTVCLGVKTNQLFLQRCLSNPTFGDPAYTTSFIPSNMDNLLRLPSDTGMPCRESIYIAPSLILRGLSDMHNQSMRVRPFHRIRKQFRNQRFDPVNVHCDIITALSLPPAEGAISQDSLMCIWKAHGATPSTTEDVYLLPVPGDRRPKDDLEPAAFEMSARYNEISRTLRSGILASARPITVSLDSWHTLEGDNVHRQPWFTAEIKISINGVKMQTYVAIPSIRLEALTGVDFSQSIFCHFPTLGTSIEFKRDTPLSFVNGIRATTRAKIRSDGQKTIMAPMPCKVLSILKTDGDEVKSGDGVMVIESMKMEVSISAAADGKFKASVSQGDAVDEGKVLCSIV